jgi:hypothetical protein
MTDAHFPQRSTPITAICLGLNDVKKIFSRLEKIVHEEGDKEISKLVKQTDMNEEQWDARKKEIKSGAFRVTVTIEGESGDRLHGDTLDLFDSPNRPTRIKIVYMTNSTAFRWWTKDNPMRSFELMLDFARPKLLDSENFVSAPTPNRSNLNVEADNETWIAAISEAVSGVLSEKSNNRKFLHQAFVYDFGLLMVGLPFAFYISWKLSDAVGRYFSANSTFLAAAAYVYLFVLAIWSYRILFGYTKWAFPAVELSENAESVRKHRAFWFAIVVGLFVNFIWEFLKS